jgi:peptidoglycan/LPS O-acetylase OafA/YrhL
MAEPARKITRLPELDLLRFIAAAAVTFYHYVSSFPSAAELAQSALEPVAAVTRYGYLGVDLFFMISGFVILWSSQNRTALEFSVSRAGRLFPSFWVAMLLAAACILLMPTLAAEARLPAVNAPMLVANATMLPGVLGFPMIDGVYWTLEVEIRFYAIVFVLLLLRQMNRIEWWLYAWLAVSLVCAQVQMPWIVRFVAIHPYGPMFVAGCFFYLVLARGMTWSRGLGLAIALGGSISAALTQRPNFITADAQSTVVIPLVIVLFFVMFLFIAFRRSVRLNPNLAYRLGALTYPLYLIHGTIGRLAFKGLENHLGLELRILFITVLALALAYLMSVTVETYGRKLFEAGLNKIIRLFGLGRRPAITKAS